MKVVHNSQTNFRTLDPLPFQASFEEAQSLEAEDPEKALSAYRNIVKRYPLKEKAYDRLMIVLRKEKRYEEEIVLISEAIKIFNDHFGKPSVHAGKRKVASLSRSLQKSLGLKADKKDILSSFQPIGRWEKRKVLAQKKAGIMQSKR